MKLAFDSPGWTLEVKMIALLIAIYSGLLEKFVMITISQSFPAIVFVRIVFLILSFVSFVHKRCKSKQLSV
jgi:hypothetical protein